MEGTNIKVAMVVCTYHEGYIINKISISGAETSLEEAASAVALQQRSEEPEKPLQVGDGKFELLHTLT